MWSVACWQSINSSWQPGVSVINTASILCYIKVSFKTFIISWNTYFLKYLCFTWSYSRHLVDSGIALFSKSLTHPNVYAFILSKLLIALMHIPKLGEAFYTGTAHGCTKSQLYDMRPASYVVPQYRPLDSGALNGWLQLKSNRVIWGSVIHRDLLWTAVSKLNTIKTTCQMYSYPCFSMMALDLSSWISFWQRKRIGYQPHRMRVVHLAMPNSNPYSKQWSRLWLVCLVMSTHPMLNDHYFMTAIAS